MHTSIMLTAVVACQPALDAPDATTLPLPRAVTSGVGISVASRVGIDIATLDVSGPESLFGSVHTTDPESGGEAPGSSLFTPDVLHRIDLELDDDALGALARDARADVLATLRMGGARWDVGLKLKGTHSFRDIDGKPSFKIDLGEYVEGQTLAGLRRLTLNNMVQDGSMIREHVVYRAYANAGVPATRHAYTEVWVNDAPYGLYAILDAMDRTWAAWALPDPGNGWLYEGGGGADLLADRFTRFHVQAQGEGEAHTDLAELVAALDAADDVSDVLDTSFDPSIFRMWATDIAAGHRDGYVRRRNNYLLYHGGTMDQWWIVPWGNDQAFRPDDGHPYDGFFGRLLLDCERSERCMERLDAALLEVADDWEASDLAGFADATAARISDACERDPRRESSCDHDKVVDFIGARPSTLRDAMGARP